MTTRQHVLAVGPPAWAAADALGRLLRLTVQRVEVEPPGSAPLADLLNDPEVAVAVLPRDRLSASELEGVIVRSTTPLLLLPEGWSQPNDMAKALVPLDGSPAAASAVTALATSMAAAGAEILVLHVIDSQNVPAFWDQPAHAHTTWAEEFMRRFDEIPGSRIKLRSGTTPDVIHDIALAESVDLVALGWSQQSSPSRARTVRSTLQRCPVPLLLIPLTAPGQEGSA